MKMFRLTVTNDCARPRFRAESIPFTATFSVFDSVEDAEKAAAKWNAHIAPYNRTMKQNVVYRVVSA